MTIEDKRILRAMFAVMSLACAQLVCAAGEQPVGPPQFGPTARPAQPLILLPKPKEGGRTCPRYDPICDQVPVLWQPSRDRTVQQMERVVRRAAPNLDFAATVREAFKCGAEGSICSELVVLDTDPSLGLEAAVQALLESHQWTQARALSVYWDRGGGLVTHGSLRELKLEDKLDRRLVRPVVKRLIVPGYPVLVSAVIVWPENDRDPNAEAWGPDTTVPREATIRTSILQLEPQLQMALSWGANNDSSLHDSILDEKPMLRRMRKHGIQCDGLQHCNEILAGVTEGRIWSWRRVAILAGQPWVWNLRSRPYWGAGE